MKEEDEAKEENNNEYENLIDTKKDKEQNENENENEPTSLKENIKNDKKEKNDSLELKINERKENFSSPKTNFVPPPKKDPYLDSNIISKIFMFWAFKIIRIATKTEMKKE